MRFWRDYSSGWSQAVVSLGGVAAVCSVLCVWQLARGADAPMAEAAHPGAGGFATIQEFVKTHCIECHGPKTSKADLTLHVYTNQTLILQDRKIWEDVLERVEAGEMPPKKKPRPSVADQAAFIGSVRALFETADANAKPDPGHVTVRRLNRTEYNNTIRDLIGIDFEPAEDFPSDDIGHGFDNIGDVLSLSPILMERYLSAAEIIMQRAILVDPPKPQPHRQSAKNLEPAGRNVPQTRFRPLVKGNLNTPFRLGIDGAYVLRTRVFGTNAGTEPVKAAWTVDGKEIATFEVPLTATEKAPATFERPLTLEPGEHRFAVTLLNPTETDPKKVEAEMKRAAAAEAKKPVVELKKGEFGPPRPPAEPKKPEPDPKRTLNVEFIELTGPADPRPITQRKLLAADPKLSEKEQNRDILTRFLSKAYRRPPTLIEVNRLLKFVDQSTLHGDKREAGLQLAMQAALVSPKFLFRVELDDRPDSSDPHAIDEFQLASRLSYFLWSSMPDDELFELAKKHQLTANLDAQVRRMLKDPKAQTLVDNFAMQWLQLKRLKGFAPDTSMFPAFDDRLRQSMQKETELFFASIIQEDRSILDLIDANYTFLDRNLAQLYGIADTAGNRVGQKVTVPGGKQFNRGEFSRVALQDRQRGGILTEASVLTVTSNPTRTSPVKRGRFILDQILGTPPPPPPPDVPQLSEGKQAELTGSLRQRMEQHRANPACANCHARMDPIGFAFENFNAIGGFREKDGGFNIDPSGTLTDGTSFSGVEQLKTMLRDKKRLFARCLTEKMLTYALGRGVEYYDRRAVNSICNALDKNDYKFSSLVIEIVKSDPFRLRRGKEPHP
jgi:hypothetical protein